MSAQGSTFLHAYPKPLLWAFLWSIVDGGDQCRYWLSPCALVDLSPPPAPYRPMGYSSVVVLRIRPKFWWMLPMGVRDNHTKYEPRNQRWRPGTRVSCAGLPFQNLQFRAKINPFLPKTALEPAENGQMKGNLHMQLDFPVPKGPLGPSNSTICPRTTPKRPAKAPEFVHIGRRLPQTKNRPYFWLHGAKCDFDRTYSTPNHPLLVVFAPQNCPNQRLDPRT